MESDHKKKDYTSRLVEYLKSKKEPLQVAALTLINAILSSEEQEGIFIYFILFFFIILFYFILFYFYIFVFHYNFYYNIFIFIYFKVIQNTISFIDNLEIVDLLRTTKKKGEKFEKLKKTCLLNIKTKRSSLSKTTRKREYKLQPTSELFQYADFKLKKHKGIYSHFRAILQDLSSISLESEEIWKSCSDAVYQMSMINPRVDNVGESLKKIFQSASNPTNKLQQTLIKKKKIAVGETNSLLTKISDLERANTLLISQLKHFDPTADVGKYVVLNKNSRKSSNMKDTENSKNTQTSGFPEISSTDRSYIPPTGNQSSLDNPSSSFNQDNQNGNLVQDENIDSNIPPPPPPPGMGKIKIIKIIIL